jgi:molybdopterin molybdotransferase
VTEATILAGGEAHHHHLALKPGKPMICGAVGSALLLGLPGNPVAALVTSLLFARPLIDRISGSRASLPEGEHLVAGKKIPHRKGRRELAPGVLTGYDAKGRREIVKVGRGGSASLLPLIQADGLIDLPAEVAEVNQGSNVLFHRFNALL